jgi:hypothetical protein
MSKRGDPIKNRLDSIAGGLSMMILFTLIWSGMAEIALGNRDHRVVGIIFFPLVLVFIFFYWKFYSLGKLLTPAAAGSPRESGGAAAVPEKSLTASVPEMPLTVLQPEMLEEKRRNKQFLIILAAEGFSILLVQNILANTGLDHLFIPCFALIVGLHFFPLGKIFGRKFDYFMGAWTTLVALTTLILAINKAVPGYMITAVTGIGCALATSLYALKFIYAGKRISADL